MGYTTQFEGHFTITPDVDEPTYKLLYGLATTRRLKRDVDPDYGIEGEFFVDAEGPWGMYEDKTLRIPIWQIDEPITQPSIWLQWLIQPDHKTLQWDGKEKFYSYKEWLFYLIIRILEPRGYKLNGHIVWQGTRQGDVGHIKLEDNQMTIEDCFNNVVTLPDEMQSKFTQFVEVFGIPYNEINNSKFQISIVGKILKIKDIWLPVYQTTKASYYRVNKVENRKMYLTEMKWNKDFNVDCSFLLSRSISIISEEKYVIEKLQLNGGTKDEN